MNTTGKIIALVIGVLLSLLGCAGPSVTGYLRSDVTISHTKSMAVIPFDNISGHPDAGKKAVNLLLTELVHTELFKIADTGEVESSLRRLRIRTTAEMDLSKLRTLGEQLQVQTIIIGSVDEYELRQEGRGVIPIVAVNARMLDAQTGDILWAISHVHDGNDWETVFGFRKVTSLSRLAQIVVAEIVESLVKELLARAEAEAKAKAKAERD